MANRQALAYAYINALSPIEIESNVLLNNAQRVLLHLQSWPNCSEDFHQHVREIRDRKIRVAGLLFARSMEGSVLRDEYRIDSILAQNQHPWTVGLIASHAVGAALYFAGRVWFFIKSKLNRSDQLFALFGMELIITQEEYDQIHRDRENLKGLTDEEDRLIMLGIENQVAHAKRFIAKEIETMQSKSEPENSASPPLTIETSESALGQPSVTTLPYPLESIRGLPSDLLAAYNGAIFLGVMADSMVSTLSLRNFGKTESFAMIVRNSMDAIRKEWNPTKAAIDAVSIELSSLGPFSFERWNGPSAHHVVKDDVAAVQSAIWNAIDPIGWTQCLLDQEKLMDSGLILKRYQELWESFQQCDQPFPRADRLIHAVESEAARADKDSKTTEPPIITNTNRFQTAFNLRSLILHGYLR